ncbi:MAG: hypothetical protein Q4G30_04960 [Actinomycetaceae bacterium]|nr:hypothetical protein [Actinomycetaceae bacterium]
MPIAQPLRGKTAWKDPRVIIGVILMVLAVVLGVMTVNAFNQTENYYTAGTDLLPGTQLQAQSLRIAEIAPGMVSENYLRQGDIPQDAVVLRTVKTGELIPVQALGTHDPGLRTMVVDLGSELPAHVGVGDAIELWQIDKNLNPTQEGLQPISLTKDAIVAALPSAPSGFGNTTKTRTEILVPVSDIPSVLSAIGAGTSIIAVPLAS